MIISTLNNYIQSLKKNTLLHGIFATCYVRDCEVRMFCDTQFLRFVCKFCILNHFTFAFLIKAQFISLSITTNKVP